MNTNPYDIETTVLLKHLASQSQNLDQKLTDIQQTLIYLTNQTTTTPQSLNPNEILDAIRETQMRFDIIEQSLANKDDLRTMTTRVQDILAQDQMYLTEQFNTTVSKTDFNDLARQLNQLLKKNDPEVLAQQLKQLPTTKQLAQIHKEISQKMNKGTAFFLCFLLSIVFVAGLAFQQELNQFMEEYIRLINAIIEKWN